MNPRRSFVVLAVALATLASTAAAQLTVLKLKSGETVEGYVVEQTSAFVKIETLEGKTVRYNVPDVAAQEETSKTGIAELDKKLEGIDRSNADALAELADWAKTQKMRAWPHLAREVLKADPQNEKANALLGYVKVGDRWYKTKSEADAARKTALEAEMKQKGFIKVAGGWISKEDKPLFDKDKNAFIADDNGVLRDKGTVMRERGLTLVKGKWVRGPSPEDQKEMDEFKKVVGDDIMIIQSSHFRLAMMATPVEKIEEYGKLCDDVYAWFLKEMGRPADFELWPRKAHIWVLKDKKTFSEWLKHWHARYGMDEKNYQYFVTGHGHIINGQGLWSSTNLEGIEDIRNLLLHNTGHFTIEHFARGLQGTPDWLKEGWSNYVEHVKLGQGHVACSTRANYGGQGGIAEKKFTTKDAKDRCRGLFREGSAEPMTNLSKLELNSLNGDHLSKSWSVVEWLMSTRKKEFIDWLDNMNRASQEEALGAAIPGWNFAKLDEEWEAYVKAKY